MANAAHLKRVSRRETEDTDNEWIAQLAGIFKRGTPAVCGYLRLPGSRVGKSCGYPANPAVSPRYITEPAVKIRA